MAEAAVELALEKLIDFAQNNKLVTPRPLLRDRVEAVIQGLSMFPAALLVGRFEEGSNASVKQWLYDTTKVAYRIEDAIDSFMVVTRTSSNSVGKLINTTAISFLRSAPSILKLVKELEEILEILRALQRRREFKFELTIIRGVQYQSFTRYRPSSFTRYRPSKYSDIDCSEVVGFDAEREEILSLLFDHRDSRRMVLSIVGMGGLGKTTLATMVYQDSRVKQCFEPCIWVSVSQKFDLRELLCSLIYCTTGSNENYSHQPLERLSGIIQKCLIGSRYFIVLDDVWSEDVWDRLKNVLPNNTISCVLITSRSLNVAAKAEEYTKKPYKLGYLEEDESSYLLLRRAFRAHGEPRNYSPDLIEIAKRLSKKSGGLPLALVASKREPSVTNLQRVEKNMSWPNVEGDGWLEILAMSYNVLSPRLKACFLYLASFPKDYKFSAKHITRMWIAEGFVPNPGEGTLENRAEDFLEVLVERCLVQVIKKSSNGRSKYCSLHVVIRDLAILKSKEHNFFTVFSEEEDSNQMAPRPSSVVRRATLQFRSPTKYVHSTNTRALLCFGNHMTDNGIFGLLKVLVLEDIDMRLKGVSWNSLEGLIHLRYLGFRKCENMPKVENVSFRRFKNLQTFDCTKTAIGDNRSLWKIPSLRHVIVGDLSMVQCPLKWDYLINLQTLQWVTLVDIPKLEYNVNLHTLKIWVSNQDISIEEGWQRLKALLSRTEQLVSLTVRTATVFVPFLTSGTSELQCHEKIESLRLDGMWEKEVCVPCIEMFPINLTKLVLVYSHLEEDPMPILERLAYLKVLKLMELSYMKEKLKCSAGGFLSLQKLQLTFLPNLSQWEIEEDAMSNLINLKIDSCGKLNALPQLRNVEKLQELLVCSPSTDMHKWMQSEEGRISTSHIAVRILDTRE